MNRSFAGYLAYTAIWRFFVRQAILLAAILLLLPVGVQASRDTGIYVVGILTAGQKVIVAYDYGSLDKGRVYAYSLETGRLVWRTSMRARLVDMCMSDSTLYVTTFARGTYMLRLKSGRIRAHFTKEDYNSPGGIACTSDLVAIGSSMGWSSLIGAFRERPFRLKWERSIPKSCIWELSAKNGHFEVLLSEVFGQYDIVHTSNRFERLQIRAKDGAILSRTPVADPRKGVPKTLPMAVQNVLTSLLKNGDTYAARTRIEHLGNLWYVGRIQQVPANSGKYAVFALHGDTGKVAWSHEFSGVADIKICGKSLIVSELKVLGPCTCKVHARTGKPGKLVSLDAETGRLQWAVKVPVR